MNSHAFIVEFAVEYKSVDLALLIAHFQYWINKNKRLGTNKRDNRTWSYQTLKEITANFPYWTQRQVEKMINKAVDLKILRKGNFNENRYDRTVWYAFEDENKFLISEKLEMEDLKERPSSISPNGEMEIAERRNPNLQKVTPIPDTIPNTIPNRDMSASPPLSEPSFGRIASSFFQKLKESNPKIKPPNLDKWASELKLLSKDSEEGTSIEDIEKVIDYIIRSKPSSNGFCWATVVLSPAALRKNFAKIWAEMNQQSGKSNGDPKKDEKLANKIWNKLQHHQPKTVDIGYNYIQFISGSNVEELKFGSKNFKEKCLEQLKIRRVKLEEL